MRQKVIIMLLLIALTLSSVAVFLQNRKIEKLENYHEAAEMLLNDLDREYDWVDAFDPYEYYDAVDALRD